MRDAARFLALMATTCLLLIGPAATDSTAAGGFVPTDRRSESAGPEKVTVRPGDHLWGISEARLAETAHHQLPDAVISSYWRKVIARNEDRIRSGDPDLIYPGEIVVLPGPD